MTTSHKNKTLATFLCLTLGSLGAHRFYLFGKQDALAWLQFSSLPLSMFLSKLYFNLNPFITFTPWWLSFLFALLMALILGLKSDERWDTQFNPSTNIKSNTTWLHAVLLVCAVGVNAIALIGVLARTFDLFYTGGAFG